MFANPASPSYATQKSVAPHNFSQVFNFTNYIRKKNAVFTYSELQFSHVENFFFFYFLIRNINISTKSQKQSQDIFAASCLFRIEVASLRRSSFKEMIFALLVSAGVQTLPPTTRAPRRPHSGPERLRRPTCRLPAAYSLIIIHVYKPASRGTVRRTSCMRDEQTAAADAV